MRWNDHSNLKDTHALFSPSSPSWANYTPERLRERYITNSATDIGTAIHEEAMWHIRKKILVKSTARGELKLELYKRPNIPDDVVDSLDFDGIFKNYMAYVNDAIGYRMDAEVILYANDLCYGTADAITFKDNFLRIHDLKTGVTTAHIEQLYAYAALFCLEYKVDPRKIQTELRIYQLNDILVNNPTGDDIMPFVDQINEINKMNKEIFERRSQYE